ncbi:MAG: undecaprenyl-diphosphate phosphatase [Pseudomonadota bacterium]
MPIFDLAILAIVQGLTEFLPISSSGHLALYPLLTGRPDQGVQIDVAVHVGSLFAVLLYFRADVAAAIRGGFRILAGDVRSREARLALLLVLATIPVVIAGLALSLSGMGGALRSLAVIGWATLIGGVLLWLADRFGEEARDDWRWRDAALMGLAQCLALVPGMSRSGVTMTAARGLGLTRTAAARFSMLMSIPTIIAAGAVVTKDMIDAGDAALGADAAIAAVLSFIAALVAIAVLMRMLRTWTMTPFVVYRLALGAILLWLAY